MTSTGTVLVTGATGFLGRHVVPALVAAGCDVVRSARKGSADVDVTADLCDETAVAELVRRAKPSHVVHLAGSTGQQSAARHVRANVVTTAALLDALAEAAPTASLCIAGSSAVYGDAGPLPVDENAPYGPRTPYAASKCAQELLAQTAGATRPIAMLRLFNLVGPGQGDQLVVGRMAMQVAEVELGRRDAVRVGNTAPGRDFVDVRDAAAAIAATTTQALVGTYNVATGVSTPVGDVLEILVAAATCRVRVRREESRSAAIDIPDQRGNSDRLRAATGWTPLRSLEESVLDTLDWWRNALTVGTP